MIAFARRSFAGRLSGVVLCMTWAATAGWAGPPNLVILLADDLGYGDVGFNGGTAVPTPRLDRLAQQAVRCASGYVSAPYCSPTRAGLLTGRYQQRFGHEFNPALLSQGGTGQGLPVGEKTLADRLSAAGYAVGLVGKWHQGEEPPFHPLQRGFTEFFGFLTGAHPYFVSQDNHYGPVYRGREPAEFSGYLTDVLADEGFVFAGVVPLAHRGVDVVRYQRLGDTPVDPTEIHLRHPFAEQLLEYVLTQLRRAGAPI